MPHRFFLKTLILLLLPMLGMSCASTLTLKGMNPAGEPVYLGTTNIESSPAFQKYIKTSQSDSFKILFVMKRLKEAEGLSYLHDGAWYNSLQAYRGGMWIFRNQYKKNQTAEAFIREHVRFSKSSGKAHLVKYPDGSLQDGFYVLLNELELLESAAMRRTQA